MKHISLIRISTTTLLIGMVLLMVGCLMVLSVPNRPWLMEIDFLDVGQGDAALIRSPEGSTILIDTGANVVGAQQLAKVLPWWQKDIDAIILSHPDRDHVGGLASILEQYRVGRIYAAGASQEQEAWREVRDLIDDYAVPLVLWGTGDSVSWPSGMRLKALWPAEGITTRSTNDLSLVVIASWGTIDALFTGDIPMTFEPKIANMPGPSVEVLKVAHHGSKYSTGKPFLGLVRPQICIVSVGVENRYGHPSQDALGRLLSVGCETLLTSNEGTIMVQTDGRSLRRVKY